MATSLSESAPISARPTIRATAVVVPIPGIEVKTARRRQGRIGGDEAFDLRLEIGERSFGGAQLALDL